MNQEILKETIRHFIFLQPSTTSQKIKKHFNLANNREFYKLLQHQETLSNTVEKFCDLAKIEVDYFRMMYEVLRDNKVRSEKFLREYLEQKDKLNKSFKAP